VREFDTSYDSPHNGRYGVYNKSRKESQYGETKIPMSECQHATCSDESDTKIMLEDGSEYELCEDHAHMNPNGTPTVGYDPNDPAKFE